MRRMMMENLFPLTQWWCRGDDKMKRIILTLFYIPYYLLMAIILPPKQLVNVIWGDNDRGELDKEWSKKLNSFLEGGYTSIESIKVFRHGRDWGIVNIKFKDFPYDVDRDGSYLQFNEFRYRPTRSISKKFKLLISNLENELTDLYDNVNIYSGYQYKYLYYTLWTDEGFELELNKELSTIDKVGMTLSQSFYTIKRKQ